MMSSKQNGGPEITWDEKMTQMPLGLRMTHVRTDQGQTMFKNPLSYSLAI